MTITVTELETLDYAGLGQPLCDVSAAADLDLAYLGQPFFGPAVTGGGGGGGGSSQQPMLIVVT